MDGFPHSHRPTGWFQVGWSHEYALGDVKPLKYFGRDVVLYRGESGRMHMFDAHCPHLGAHLGHGGWVTDDDLNCPFHGWRFDSDGANVEIPYSERMKQSRKCLVAWDVREDVGVIVAWHDVNGQSPTWEPPVVLPSGEAVYYPMAQHGARAWKLRAHPQVVMENGCDSAHFRFLHKAAENPVIASFRADGHMFRLDQRMTFGGGKKSTWLTPDGAIEASLIAEAYGVGLNIARFAGTDDAVNLIAVTPIDDVYSEFRMTNWVPRAAGDTSDVELPTFAIRRIEEQFKQAMRDFTVWENMRYVQKAPLTPEESGAFLAVRSWAEQFYPPESPRGGVDGVPVLISGDD